MFNAPATNKESVWFMYDSWMSHTWITINYVSLQGLILYYLVFINSVNSCVNYHKSHAIEAMDFDFQPSETGMPLYKMNWRIYLLMPSKHGRTRTSQREPDRGQMETYHDESDLA